MTQTEVYEAFNELKKEWDSRVVQSGKSEQMFIATDATGYVASFLYNYNEAKKLTEAEGLAIPELVKGLQITAA